MGSLKYKILRDLWVNKVRTLQVMLIIGIGSAAIGMILGTRNLIVPGMQEIWMRMNPAMINIFVYPPISEDDLITLAHTPGVAEIEGFSSASIEWKLKPEDEWRTGGLTARNDYRDQNMNKLELLEGGWPEARVAANGQDALAYGIPDGAVVTLRVNHREYRVQTRGKVYDQLTNPATFGGTAQFYVSRDYYEYLTGETGYGRLLVKAPVWDKTAVTQLADQLEDRLLKMGSESGRLIADPNKHFFQDQIDGLFFLMGVLGALSLILGLLLVYNTITGIIESQTDQIGVMKAIGARTGQVTRCYLSVVLIYGVLALLVSLPLGILGAWSVTLWLIRGFGAEPGAFEVDQTALILQCAIALFAPLLVALAPIFRAARITVREALSTYGLTAGAGLLERGLTKLTFISRLAMLTVSSAFRHKGRVFLLQLALVLSGLVFMMVVSVRDSVVYTIRDVLFSILDTNVTLVFENPERIDRLEKLTLDYPGIKAVEMWGLASAGIRPQAQKYSKDDPDTVVLGVPLPTRLYGYQLRGGRWLDPADTSAIVLNVKLVDELNTDLPAEQKIGVGDWITIRYDEKNERDFQIVGLLFDPILTTFSLVNREALLHDIGSYGRAQSIWIQTDQTGVAAEEAIAKGLRSYYASHNIGVSAQRGVFGLGSDSTAATAQAFVDQFNFLIVLLGIMAVVIGAVGSIALSGALSLSVMERRREIGVMRAIGASSWTIFRMFIGEGLILGWLSWLVALAVTVPASQVMVAALGNAFKLDILYKFQPAGPILWLAIITILSILASWLPARGATRISVHESLAYQ
ncbi:MAG: FtsX-like permease family protein [Anaerolineae bacterium]|nr:FtsX-like permease family protein [Anaerolineae bacterium]